MTSDFCKCSHALVEHTLGDNGRPCQRCACRAFIWDGKSPRIVKADSD